LLLGAGLLSEAVYVVAVILLPWWRYGGTLSSWSQILGEGWLPLSACLVGAGVLVVAYLLGWRALRTGEVGRRAIWGFAVAFAATLFWLMPITSDLFTYLSHAHMLTDVGVNPLLAAPLDTHLDRVLLAYPAFYVVNPTVYGPAWALISAPGTMGQYDVVGGVFYLKGLAVAGYLGSAWLVERILRQVRPAAALAGLYLFAWNPLVLLMAVGDGHNDMVMMALVLLAAWLMLRERWAVASGALILSVWVKYVSAACLPLFAIYTWRWLAREPARKAWPVLVRAGLAGVGVSAVVLLPLYAAEGQGAVAAWAAGMAKRFLQPANWHLGSLEASTWILGAGLLLFAVAYLFLAWQFSRGPAQFERLVDATFVVMLLAFLLGAARSQPWHLIWPAALAGLSQRRWAWPVVACLSAFLLWGQIWVEWGTPGLGGLQ
jgi:alpha-1,6-mannosyltransferase